MVCTTSEILSPATICLRLVFCDGEVTRKSPLERPAL